MAMTTAPERQIGSLVAELHEAIQQYMEAIGIDALYTGRKDYLARINEIKKRVDELQKHNDNKNRS